MIFRLESQVVTGSTVCSCFSDINASELVYDDGVLCANFYHLDCVHWTSSGSILTVFEFKFSWNTAPVGYFKLLLGNKLLFPLPRYIVEAEEETLETGQSIHIFLEGKDRYKFSSWNWLLSPFTWPDKMLSFLNAVTLLQHWFLLNMQLHLSLMQAARECFCADPTLQNTLHHLQSKWC